MNIIIDLAMNAIIGTYISLKRGNVSDTTEKCESTKSLATIYERN